MTYFEAVTKVDVYHLASVAFKHEVGWMTIAETEYMADHTVDCE